MDSFGEEYFVEGWMYRGKPPCNTPDLYHGSDWARSSVETSSPRPSLPSTAGGGSEEVFVLEMGASLTNPPPKLAQWVSIDGLTSDGSPAFMRIIRHPNSNSLCCQ